MATQRLDTALTSTSRSARPRPSEPRRVRLGHGAWLLDLRGLRPLARDTELLRQVMDLPQGSGLYVLASGEPDSLAGALATLSVPPRWRVVYRRNGSFEAVLRRV